MNSIESNFVPYQIAVDMKSIGFDEPCLGKFYFNQLEIGGNWRNNDFKEDPDVFISAPLYQQAFKFVLCIIEKDTELERKFMDRYFLDFSSEGWQMDDSELSTTYESDEETLREIINFIRINK